MYFFSIFKTVVVAVLGLIGVISVYWHSDNWLKDSVRHSITLFPSTHRTGVHDDKESNSDKLAQCTIPDRLGRMRRVCQAVTPLEQPYLQNWKLRREALYNLSLHDLQHVVRKIISDENHKVLFCTIPKTGSTSWRYHLVKNSDKFMSNNTAAEKNPNVHSPDYLKKYNIRYLNTMSKDKILYRLDNYFTFLNVRHPLDRLLSSYNEKFFFNTAYKESMGVDIIQRYRKNAVKDALQNGTGVTFTELLTSLLDRIKLQKELDVHWENYFNLCYPCMIRYDYVAKMESSSSDLSYIISQHLSDNYVEENLNVKKDHSKIFTSGEEVLMKYTEVDRKLFDELLDYYKLDMDMFGYSATRNINTGEIRIKCGEMNGGCC